MMKNPFSLEGKTILITGASAGIGRAIAISCAGMGAKVCITARNQDRLNETLQQLVRDYQRMEAAGMEKELEKTDWKIKNSWLLGTFCFYFDVFSFKNAAKI